jgi:hypothetical protein
LRCRSFSSTSSIPGFRRDQNQKEAQQNNVQIQHPSYERATDWPDVPKAVWPTRLTTLFAPKISDALAQYANLHTVQDLLTKTPAEVLVVRNIGKKTIRTIWGIMERFAGGPRKLPENMGRAKIDVTRLPTGCITVGRQQRNPSKKSRNPKLRWMGEVPLHEAVRSFITQTLTGLHLLPNVQLLAELETEVLSTTSNGGAFAFNGAYGRVGIVLKWVKGGSELFVEVKSQAPGQKTTNITRHVFYYEDKAKMLEIKVGPVVRRLAATIGSLQKTGIPGPEIRDFIKKRLPTI